MKESKAKDNGVMKSIEKAKDGMLEYVTDVKDNVVVAVGEAVKSISEVASKTKDNVVAFVDDTQKSVDETINSTSKAIKKTKKNMLEVVKESNKAVGETVESAAQITKKSGEKMLQLVDDTKEDIIEGIEDAKSIVNDIDIGEAIVKRIQTEDCEAKLRRETFENSDRMGRFMRRKFLLVVITIMQAIIILLMLGLLVFIPDEATVSPPTKQPVDVTRALSLIAALMIPVLLFKILRTNTTYDGIKRWPWGEDSLLQEDTEQGLWYFGPRGDNNYGVAGLVVAPSGRIVLE